MNDQTDSQLLRAYAENRTETAFVELLRRHVDFVYSAARRMVSDPHLAEDVTQGVFVALAKNARQLGDRTVLSGWLHRTAQNIAAQTVRTIERRRAREQEVVAMNETPVHESDAAWENIAPQLDAALGELSEPDRDALLLRYFERKSAREMAQTLNVSEEAAQKRVNRAVERLREIFSKRSMTIGANGLVILLSTNAVQAAPVSLAAMLSTAVFTNAVIGSGTTTFFNSMALTKLKVGVITSVVLASAATSLVIENQSQARIRETGQQLRQQAGQIAELETIRDAVNPDPKPENSPINSLGELEKLREEATALRSDVEKTAGLQDEVKRLQALLAQSRPDLKKTDTNFQGFPSEELQNRTRYAFELSQSLWEYASQNKGQFPTNFQQAARFMNSKITNVSSADFEIVFQGTTDDVKKFAHPDRIILIKERQPWANFDGKRAIAWTSLGRTGSYYSPKNGDFDPWIKEHTATPKASRE